MHTLPAQLQQSSGLILLLPEELLGASVPGNKQFQGWCPLPAPWATKHLLHYLNTVNRQGRVALGQL